MKRQSSSYSFRGLLLLALVTAGLLLLTACGSSGSDEGENSTGGQNGSESNSQPTGDTVRLEKVSAFDTTSGSEAFTFLKPTGWNANAQVIWRHDLSNLASASVVVSDPSSFTAAEIFPIVPFTWQEGGVAFFPVGSVYLGNQVQPPIFEPVEFVSQMVLPTFRSQVNPQIIEWEETPDVSQELASSVQEPGLDKFVRSGRVRVEYTLNGSTIHEDFFVSLVFSQAQGLPITLWGPDRIYSFRALAGELDDASPLLHTVVFSSKANQRWLNEYLQVVDLWHQGQLQAIQSAGELSRYIAQVNDEILDITTETYAQQQRVNDRISREWSEVIRGVETYADPFQEDSIELPSGFDRTWASANGEYILSNDAFFDPNRGSSIDWEELRRLP